MSEAKRILAADQTSRLAWHERKGRHFLELERHPFVPRRIVTLSVLQLRTLTLELSDLLGADSGSKAAGMKGHEAKPTNALSDSAIAHGAPDGRS